MIEITIWLLFFLVCYPVVDHHFWMLIDDHESLRLMHAIGGLDLSALYHQFWSHEEIRLLVDTGETVRFRPAYYVLSDIETYFFGESVRARYMFHSTMFALSAVVTYRIFRHFAAIPVALLGILIFLGSDLWSDLIPKLTPSEGYALWLGGLLAVLALRFLDRRGSFGTLLAAWFVAALVCLTKEPMSYFMLLLVGYLTFVAIITNHSRLLALSGAISLACAPTAVISYLLTRHMSASHLLSSIFAGTVKVYLSSVFTDPYHATSLVLGAIGILFIALRLLKKGKDTKATNALIFIGFLIFVEASFFFNCFVYSEWINLHHSTPTGIRYDFPQVLFQTAFITFAVGAIHFCLGATTAVTWIRHAVVAGILLSVIAYQPFVFSSVTFDRIKSMIADDRTVKNALEDVSAALENWRAQGRSAVVIVRPYLVLWEPTIGAIALLRQYFRGTPIYLDQSDDPDAERRLADERLDFGDARLISSSAKLPPHDECIIVLVGWTRHNQPGCHTVFMPYDVTPYLPGDLPKKKLLTLPNAWQQRLIDGEPTVVAFSAEGCDVLPSGWCNVKFVLKLAKEDGRWCETLQILGTENELGTRCNARPEFGIISLIGALFSFNDRGEVFREDRRVGVLKLPPPANE